MVFWRKKWYSWAPGIARNQIPWICIEVVDQQQCLRLNEVQEKIITDISKNYLQKRKVNSAKSGSGF